MRKRAKLTTAIFLAASVNVSYGGENCLPPDAGMNNPMKIFECFQGMLDTQQQQIGKLTAENQSQQKQIAALKKENQSLRQKTDAISVSSNGNVVIGTPLSSRTQISGSIPTEKFEINGGIIIFGDTGNWPTLMTINGNQKTGAMKFKTMWDGFHFDTGHTPNAFYIHEDGRVGIGITTPTEKLEVSGNIKANAFNTGDIFFEKDGKTLWQMFEDEHGLYVKHIKTGIVYRLMLEKIQ